MVMVLLLAGLSACGGGGGGSSSSPYTGLATPAVVTAANAENIARQTLQGGDLGANATTLAPARSGDTRAAAERPMALTLVRILSGAANAAFSNPVAVRAPQPRSTATDTLYDGLGGWVDYTLNVNDVTGAFTGTFAFTNYHGESGGVINGPVSVSGQYVQGVGITEILFNFQSVRIVDGAEDVTAIGTVDLISGTSGGSAILDIVFVDNVSRKTLWLSNVTLVETIGTSYYDTTLSGRIYLHDYGYVDMITLVPFHYLAGNPYPSSGRFVVTGKDNKKVQLTVVDTTQYLLDVDTNGDGAWEVTAVVKYW
jgi:hypothetical protein